MPDDDGEERDPWEVDPNGTNPDVERDPDLWAYYDGKWQWIGDDEEPVDDTGERRELDELIEAHLESERQAQAERAAKDERAKATKARRRDRA